MKISTPLFHIIAFALLFTACEFPFKKSSPPTTENDFSFWAKDFLQNRYFFLDTAYRRYYIKKYAPGNHTPSSPPPEVGTLMVWRSVIGAFTKNGHYIRDVMVDSNEQYDSYELLERDRHYYLNDSEGYIRFVDTIHLLSPQPIAIYLRTADSADFPYLQKGHKSFPGDIDIRGDTLQDTLWTLWTLRPREPIFSFNDDPARFPLLWRHAYYLYINDNVVSITVTIEKKVGNYSDLEKKVDNRYLNDIVGIPYHPLSYSSAVHTFSHSDGNYRFHDLVLPPFDTTDAGLDIFNNPALGDTRDSALYQYSKEQLRVLMHEGSYNDLFIITVTIVEPDTSGQR
jgi:hypothetical protein